MSVIVLSYVNPLQLAGQLPGDHHADSAGTARPAGSSPPGSEPWTGGVILTRAGSTRETHAAVAENSFIRAGLAEDEAIEFLPSKRVAGFETLRRHRRTLLAHVVYGATGATGSAVVAGLLLRRERVRAVSRHGRAPQGAEGVAPAPQTRLRQTPARQEPRSSITAPAPVRQVARAVPPR